MLTIKLVDGISGYRIDDSHPRIMFVAKSAWYAAFYSALTDNFIQFLVWGSLRLRIFLDRIIGSLAPQQSELVLLEHISSYLGSW